MADPLRPRPPGARKRSASRAGDEWRGPSLNGYFKTFDGTKLFYSIEGTGKPVVFCYGLVCSSLHWTYQIQHFRQNYQTIWFDYRGHHNSEVPKDLGSLTIENIARDLGALLTELGVDDAVLLGHSMGVNVVLDFYRQYPERVKGMVLANGTAQRPLENLFHHNSAQTFFKILRKAYDVAPHFVNLIWNSQKANPVMRSIVTFGGFNPHLTPPEDVALYVDQVAEMDPSIMMNLIASYDAYDATAWLHTIAAPTLILAGEHDKIVPVPQQELLHQLIPKSELDVIQHGSHCPQMDLPELVNLKVTRFLEKLGY